MLPGGVQREERSNHRLCPVEAGSHDVLLTWCHLNQRALLAALCQMDAEPWLIGRISYGPVPEVPLDCGDNGSDNRSLKSQ